MEVKNHAEVSIIWAFNANDRGLLKIMPQTAKVKYYSLQAQTIETMIEKSVGIT